jgi:general L-amino acid transport system permease protein
MNAARLRDVAWQAGILAVICIAVVLAGRQARANLEARGIARGFEYLGRPAGFEIAPGVLEYSSRDTYARALAVGVVNTLRVSALAMAIATVLGVGVAVARLSRRRPVAMVAAAAIEALRNTPLLLQLFCWHSLWWLLPGPQADTPEKLARFARNEAWGHHASCTNKLGSDTDAMSVVDGRFRVRGVKRLRVVDASIFPAIPCRSLSRD